VAASDGALSFLELGLDSLLLTQLASAVQRRFDVRVSFRELQEEHATMDLLAAHIDARSVPDAPAPASAPAAPPYPIAAPAAMAAPAPSTAPGSVAWLVEQQLRLMAQQLA